MRLKRIGAVVVILTAAAFMTVATGQAQASPGHGYDCAPGSRPTALPLPTGASQGAVLGGRGVDLLYGWVSRAGGPQLPAAWQRAPGTGDWTVRDLSRGGTITGFATGQDGAGDVLVSSGIVLTAAGDVLTLRPFASPHSSIYARQINARGQVAGAVFGPDPDEISVGAVWPSPTTAPRPLQPLPLPGTFDSLASGLNDRGDTVGTSDINDYSDGVGGYWPAGSTVGVVLPGLAGSHHSIPTRINNRGRIVGQAFNGDFTLNVAAVWDRTGRLLSLGTAQASDDSATFYGLSEDGRAVGTSRGGTAARLIYWRGRPGDPLRSLLPLSGTWQAGVANAHYVTSGGFIGGDSRSASGNDTPVIWPCADRQSFVAPGWYGR